MPATFKSIPQAPEKLKCIYIFQVVLGTYPGLRPPMIPGIDLVGSIEQTLSDKFKV